MRILFATTNKYIPELHGGLEVNTHELCIALRERSIEIGVLCGLAGVGLTGLRARLHRKMLHNPRPMDKRLGYPVWRCYNPIQHVCKVASFFKPDILIVQEGAHFELLVTACLQLNLPVICYLHTQDRLVSPPELLAHPNLSFIANSNFTMSLHPEKKFLGVLPPIVPPRNYSVDTMRSHAVFVNPAPHKGLGVVFGIAEARPDVPFLFVVNRKGFARHGKLAWHRLPNVEVVGPTRDMRTVYRRAKVVLAPTQALAQTRWAETWGRIATEAHFSAIPVLASDSGGLPEAVGPGGRCLQVDAPLSAWLGAFTEIWDDPIHYEQLCERARQYSQRHEIRYDAIVEAFLGFVHATAGVCRNRT